MQAVQDGKPHDLAPNLGWARHGQFLPEALMRAFAILAADELCDEASEVLGADDEHVIEQLASQRADEPFGERIHVRASNGRAHDASPDGREHFHELRSQLRITVANEHLRRAVKRRVSRLPRAPSVSRGICNSGMNDHPPSQVR
jgi:hypothetical protein